MIQLQPGSGGFGYVVIALRGEMHGHVGGVVPHGNSWALCNASRLSLEELREVVSQMNSLPPPTTEQLERQGYWAATSVK